MNSPIKPIYLSKISKVLWGNIPKIVSDDIKVIRVEKKNKKKEC